MKRKINAGYVAVLSDNNSVFLGEEIIAFRMSGDLGFKCVGVRLPDGTVYTFDYERYPSLIHFCKEKNLLLKNHRDDNKHHNWNINEVIRWHNWVFAYHGTDEERRLRKIIGEAYLKLNTSGTLNDVQYQTLSILKSALTDKDKVIL